MRLLSEEEVEDILAKEGRIVATCEFCNEVSVWTLVLIPLDACAQSPSFTRAGRGSRVMSASGGDLEQRREGTHGIPSPTVCM